METISKIPLNNKLTREERGKALELAQPIIEYGLPRAKEKAIIPLTDTLEIAFREGTWAYAGATVVIDILEKIGKEERRPASYAFFEDKVICVDDYLREVISRTPAHEVGVDELLRLMVTLGIQGDE